MQNPDALRAFFGRVTPVLPELFNMAHAICGNYDLAEYALQYTLLEAWRGESRGGMGFREGLRHTMRRIALQEALSSRQSAREYTWDGLTAPDGDALMELLAAESADMRRVVALRYGCALPQAKIAKLMGIPSARVKELLSRFERHAARRLPAQEVRRFEARLSRAVGRAFGVQSDEMPSLGVIYRAFEADALETRRPRRLVSKMIRRALIAVLMVVCAVVFWLAAVLIQPVELKPPASIVTEQAQ
ncbi:MAG: sigma-70 family RNA polymerase sigma factor [Clostridia bacterium]|nr:sigma-70 family RNA polymerase sigma factor [Clostridia bacterium]